MVTGSWLNADGLMLQYGTQKANPEEAGDYLSYGQTRVAEVYIDLGSLSTSNPQVQSLTTFFPAGYNFYVEKVEVITEVTAASSGTATLSVGLGYFSGSTYNTITEYDEKATSSALTTQAYSASLPGVTAISNTAFVNALALVSSGTAATAGTAGAVTTLTYNSTGAGGYIGSTNTSTHPAYITAEAGTTAFTGSGAGGQVRVRVFYRGIGTIYQ
jgi:hypothetical protein